MKIVFSLQISEVGTDSVLHIPGLNAMRQDLLVHVPSGNIMIWKQATVRGEIPQYCSNSQTHDTKWPKNVFGHLNCTNVITLDAKYQMSKCVCVVPEAIFH